MKMYPIQDGPSVPYEVVHPADRVLEQKVEEFPRCSNYDDGCSEVCSKMECFMYDPEKGYCPFLSGEIK
jgi:hypothetical protein